MTPDEVKKIVLRFREEHPGQEGLNVRRMKEILEGKVSAQKLSQLAMAVSPGTGNSRCSVGKAEMTRLNNIPITATEAHVLMTHLRGKFGLDGTDPEYRRMTTFDFSDRQTTKQWGTAWPHKNRFAVYRKSVWVFLHELAHVWAPKDAKHGTEFGRTLDELHRIYIEYATPQTKEEKVMKEIKEMKKMTLKDLVQYHNELAEEAGQPTANRFSDKAAAIKRVVAMQAQVIEVRKAQSAAVVEEVPTEEVPTEEVPAEEVPVNEVHDPEKVQIPDDQIKAPEKKSKKESKEPKEPRVTKSSLGRAAFEKSGKKGITKESLMEASGHDEKNVGVMMHILANAKRTKDPIQFVYVSSAQTYYKPEYAPSDDAQLETERTKGKTA